MDSWWYLWTLPITANGNVKGATSKQTHVKPLHYNVHYPADNDLHYCINHTDADIKIITVYAYKVPLAALKLLRKIPFKVLGISGVRIETHQNNVLPKWVQALYAGSSPIDYEVFVESRKRQGEARLNYNMLVTPSYLSLYIYLYTYIICFIHIYIYIYIYICIWYNSTYIYISI